MGGQLKTMYQRFIFFGGLFQGLPILTTVSLTVHRTLASPKVMKVNRLVTYKGVLKRRERDVSNFNLRQG